MLFSALIGTILTAGILLFDYHQQKRLIGEKIHTVGALAAPVLSAALWAIEDEQVDTQLATIVSNTSASYAGIREPFGQVTQYVGKRPDNPKSLQRFALSYHDENSSAPHDLGELEIAQDSTSILNDSLKKAGILLLAQFAKVLLLVSFMAWLFDRWLVQPLHQLGRQMRKHTANVSRSLPALSLSRPHRPDELQALVDNINQSHMQLAKSSEQLASQNRQLQHSVKEKSGAESQLDKQFRTLQNIFDSLNDCILVIRENGTITWVNHACLHLFQPLEENQLIGENLDQLCEFRFTLSEKVDAFAPTTFIDTLRNSEISGYCTMHNGLTLPVTLKITAQYELDSQHYHTVTINDESHSQKLDEVSFRASHDYLTGVANRLSFEHELEDILTSERVITQQYTTCLVSIDSFKMINTLYGHMAGDLALKQIAQILRDCVRDTDMVARLTGDEFGIIFNEGVDECEIPCRRILKAFSELQLDNDDSEALADRSVSNIDLSASFGLTPVYAGDSINEIFNRADKACFLAKKEGGGAIRHILIDPEDGKQADGAAADKLVIADIKELLDSDHIMLFAQPIVRLNNLNITDHVEILLRMVIEEENGELSTRSPYTYLQVAEKYNLTHMLDRRMLNLLTRHLIDSNIDADNININLSVKSMLHPVVQNKIYELLQLAKRLRKRIYIEITETALIKRLDDIREFLQDSKIKGAHYAIDDFGEGFASYGTLQNLPIDMIKIDGSLVKQVTTDEKVRAVIASIHSVAQSHEALTVAEHIPDEISLQALREIGIDYGQSFMLGEPVPVVMQDASDSEIRPPV